MRLIKILLALFTLAVLCFGAFSYWLYSSLHYSQHHAKANEFIKIPKGSTPNDIIGKLYTEGVLANQTPILIYLRAFGDAKKLQAGEYQFVSPVTPLQVLKELEKGENQTIRLTIPEGFTRFDIAPRIVKLFPQNPPMDEKAALYLMSDTTLIKDIAPNTENLEGYMYPSTYEFPPETKAKDIIKRMVEQFRKVWKPEYAQRAGELGRTPNEIITIASLIETESKFPAERKIVSSVIYNRLNKNIALGIDQTAVYIAKMQDRWDGVINKSDLEVDSPYNTRKYAGIPPGPISSVSENAIEAALNPAETDYIFYVLNVENNDGSHNFYSSAAEFEKGKAAYQKWLAEQRAK